MLRLGRGRFVAAAVGLTVLGGLSACSGSSTGVATSTSAAGAAGVKAPESAGPESVTAYPSTPAATAEDVRTVEVTVAGRKVTPAPGRVEVAVGETVRITITSDVANEVHVHGVDVEKALPAGKPTSLDVVPGEAGVYEVELHEPTLLLFQLVVR